jgi:hypothetical protein
LKNIREYFRFIRRKYNSDIKLTFSGRGWALAREPAPFVLQSRVARWHIFKPKFGQFFEGLAMEDVGIFYGHLVYFIAIWYIL